MNNVLLSVQRQDDAATIARVLEVMRYTVTTADPSAPLERYVPENPDIIIIEASAGLSMVAAIRRTFPYKAILAVLPEHDASRAVELMRAGVFDCFDYPLQPEDVRVVMQHVARRYPSRRVDVIRPRLWQRLFSLRFLRWYAIATAMAAVLAGLLMLLLRPSEVGSRFELPYDNPTAVVASGDHLWVGNWYTQSIYGYQIKGDVLHLDRKVELSGFGPVALALNDRYMWSFGNDFLLRQHVNSNRFEVVSSYRIAEQAPAGMAFVGSDLWLNDANSRKIYQYSLAKGVLVAAVETSLAVPIGPAWDGRRLWFADAKTGKITSYMPKPGGMEQLAMYSVPRETTGMLAGIAVDAGKLYLLFADNPSYILAFRERELKRER